MSGLCAALMPFTVTCKSIDPHYIEGKLSFTCLRSVVPNFVVPGTHFIEDNFSTDRWGHDFGVIQMHYIYCALSFYYYYISSTSDHQSLDPRVWRSNGCLKWLICSHTVSKSGMGFEVWFT